MGSRPGTEAEPEGGTGEGVAGETDGHGDGAPSGTAEGAGAPGPPAAGVCGPAAEEA
ncbi:hypothetical protein ACGF12_14415 [Kitasatospora sp. NPDC048296]|uniref:hypothetical protein n=1 Tax=Kitasatospora sp. NPDC048296 TaxID=3364048 RepID=UPI00371808C2